MSEEQQWVVIVGASSFDTDLDNAYDVWGPYDFEQAVGMRDEVLEVWNREDERDAVSFVHGEPFVELRSLRTNSHPFYSDAAQAAANWYIDKETFAV